MSFMAQRDMPREQQIEEAAKFSGIPAAVIDGIWKTESGRGTHPTMVGPKTKWGEAKGHFQQLDGIVDTWSKRLGKQLDPFDFSDGLTMMAHHMKENMDRYGNVDEAVLAYHGGTNKKNWGSKTRQYLELVTGKAGLKGGDSDTVPRQPRTQPQYDSEGKRPHLTADQVWTADDDLQAARAAAQNGAGGPYERTFDLRTDNGELLAGRRLEESAAIAKQAEITQRTFFGDVLPAAYANTMNPTFRFMQRLSAEPGEYEQDAEFMAAQRTNWAKTVEGFTEQHEHDFLLNATNPSDLARRRMHLEEQRRTSRIVAEDGLRGMGAMFLSGMADPTTYITGFGAMKAAYMTGRGALQLAREGHRASAVASAVAENALGNVAYEAAMQAMGEHRTVGDYVMAGAMGLIPAAMSLPSLSKSASIGALNKQVGDAAKRDAATFDQVVRDLGTDATTKDILDGVKAKEAERLAKEVADLRGRAQPAERDVIVRDPTDEAAIREAELEIRAERDAHTQGGQPDAMPEVNTMSWRTTNEKAVGGRTYREFLDSVADNANADPVLAKAANMLRELADPKVWDMPTKLSGNARENVRHDGLVTMRKDSSDFTKVHEAVHVATLRPIEQFRRGKTDGMGAQTLAGVRKLDRLYKQVKKDWEAQTGKKVGKDPTDHTEYALKDMHEFAAQALSSPDFQKYLSSLDGTKGKTRLREFVEAVAKVLGINAKGSKLDEVTDAISDILTARDTVYKDAAGKTANYAPKAPHPADVAFDKKYGLDALDDSTPVDRAKKKAMRSMLREMEDWARRNPRKEGAADTVMDNKLVNMATPATLLAQSDHPAARWVSAVLLEQTMGAHGRGPNAAIATHTLAQEYAGNFQNNFDNLYATWRNERVGLVSGTWDDIAKQSLRKQFNREVAAEIEGRLLGYPESDSIQVRNAANLAEKQFELMRQEQIANTTPGYGALPETSRGYMPHLLDSAKVANMTDAQRRAYTAALKDEFLNGLEDMDEVFAEKVAKAYMKHATDRAAGLSDIPADPLNHSAAEYVREAMKAAGMTYDEIRLMEGKMARGAASHTKKRLKMDTLKVHTDAEGGTFQLLDLFRTDMNDIVRGHARRVAGEVALVQYGVQGSAGLQLIKEMMSLSGDYRLTPDQTKAMKQTFSELLGRPIDLTEESQALNGLLTYTSLTKLGGMGFTQLGEYSNMALHLGLGHTFEAASSFPRLISEVRKLARGEQVENGLLSSMEFRGGGGEFGVEGYRISKFDTTGREFEAYGQSTAGPLTRALKQSQYGMGIVSMHRAVQAVQQRGAAEQIVLKVWRQINEGKELGPALKDMGFDDATVAELRTHMGAAVEFNGGRVKTFDITKLPQDLQVKFDQAVRRGVYQIIQGTFIGERGHWNHSQLGRLLTQFRNYPIVAMEKQLGRTIVNQGGGAKGVAVAAGMIVASAGMVLPVYAARVAYNAMTRDDKDAYIDRMFSPEEVLKNIMNYIALTGLMQDVVQGMFSVGSAVNDDWKWMESTGGREGTGRTTLGSIVPAIGSVEELLRLPASTNDPHKLFRALPYSNTPALIPFIEALRK